MSYLKQDTLRLILESAILAPSADNQHRVRFKLEQNAIRVTYTEASLPPVGGYKRALVLMSLGALAENLSIAASHLGLHATTTLLPDPNQPDWVLQIDLKPVEATADPLWQFIPLRHTNRRVFFRGTRMSNAELEQLDSAVRPYPACQLRWLNEPSQRNPVLRLMRRAETERFHTQALHEELFSAIRFDQDWQTACPEGLPPGALGVEMPLRPFFAALRHWPVMRAANLLGMHHLMGWRACDLPCRLAPDLGLLAVKNPDTQAMFDTGRAFQRLWLEVTRQGRVLQPMPASALFALDGARTEGIPTSLQHVLAEGWQSSLGDAIPLMPFRIGFAKASSTVAGRRKVEDYLV